MAESKSLKITKVKSLKRLATKIPQNRDKGRSETRPAHAIDTETWKGDIFLIADSDGDYLDKFKGGISIDSVIKFLTRPKFETSWNFCYNLTYDASVILKLLDKEILSTYKQKRASDSSIKSIVSILFQKRHYEFQKENIVGCFMILHSFMISSLYKYHIKTTLENYHKIMNQ